MEHRRLPPSTSQTLEAVFAPYRHSPYPIVEWWNSATSEYTAPHQMTSLTRIMEDLWVEVGAILQPVPGMKYVKVFDDAHKPRKDCYFVLELTDERLPTPLPFPDDSNLASVFTSPLVLRDAVGNFLAKVTGDNPIQLTPQEFPSFLKIDDFADFQKYSQKYSKPLQEIPLSSAQSEWYLQRLKFLQDREEVKMSYRCRRNKTKKHGSKV